MATQRKWAPIGKGILVRCAINLSFRMIMLKLMSMKSRKVFFHTFCLGMVLYQLWGTFYPPIYGNENYRLRSGIRSATGVGGFFTFFTGPLQQAFFKRFSLIETTVVVSEKEKFTESLDLNTPQHSYLLIACLSDQGMSYFIQNYNQMLLERYPRAQKIQMLIKSADLFTYKKGDKVHERFHETFRDKTD